LAAVATIRQSPGDPRPATAVAIASPPENQAAARDKSVATEGG
jgi:hypothetical protein